MLLCRVVGSVVSANKDSGLIGYSLHIVEKVNRDGESDGHCFVSVNTVGARQNDLILVVQGSAAQQIESTRNRPVDAVSVAIVDEISISGETYRL
jgi:microcompartment protein CcmK/EutM